MKRLGGVKLGRSAQADLVVAKNKDNVNGGGAREIMDGGNSGHHGS
jgi:hypothetical protein